jgi:hypothetical protein
VTAKIEIKTDSYNQRRYSKPWIAVVNFSNTPKGEYAWGDWVGDHNNGSNGILVISAEEGDIIASGQKDYRGNKTEITYYQVSNGALLPLSGKVEAYHLSTAD